MKEALEAGNLGLQRFVLAIRPVSNSPLAGEVRLEVDDVRILFHSGIDEYEYPAGIIMQEIFVADVNLSGWMVRGLGYRANGEQTKPLCYLSRPSQWFSRDVLLPLGFGASEENVNAFLISSMSDFYNRILAGQLRPPILRHGA